MMTTVAGILLFFVSLTSALELPATDFFVCFHRTADKMEVQIIRIHQLSDENKCVVVHSVAGQDQLIYQSGWFSFCNAHAEKKTHNLQRNLWQCEKQKDLVYVFYATL